MVKKTILIDAKTFETMDEKEELNTEEYNLTVPDCLKITPEDERDLDEMLIESGLLKEVTIN